MLPTATNKNDFHPDQVNKPEMTEEEREATLPPIAMIVIPATTTKSAQIRWLRLMGYRVATIANYLGIKYQMVRNITTTTPKRAAREDLPELKIELKEQPDDIELVMDAALDDSLMNGRAERVKKEKADRKALKRVIYGHDEMPKQTHKDETWEEHKAANYEVDPDELDPDSQEAIDRMEAGL